VILWCGTDIASNHLKPRRQGACRSGHG
jgi:hypothetical protein